MRFFFINCIEVLIMKQKYLKTRGLVFLLLVLGMTGSLSTDMYLAAFPTILKEFGTKIQTYLHYFKAHMSKNLRLAGNLSAMQSKVGKLCQGVCGIESLSLASSLPYTAIHGRSRITP